MPNKKQPIAPIFRGERPHGEVIEGHLWIEDGSGCYYIQLKEEPQTNHVIKPESLKMSLDGKEWYSMERIEELIELGERYEDLGNYYEQRK